MNINKRIKELQEEINSLKDMQHNNGMRSAARDIKNKLDSRMTPAELKFQHIAELKHLKLKSQYKIEIVNKDRIEKFYFADFCDPVHKLIFEIDGEYHFTEEQRKKDLKRTKALYKAGYKVFRITNEEVFAGKTTNFLVNAYRSIGIKI